jgi:hypothetical protein
LARAPGGRVVAAAIGAAAWSAAPATAAAAPGSAASINITYTERAPFKNAAGQTCREYRTQGGTFGTACQDGSGQWRVAN